MAELKDIIDAVLRDTVRAQHQTNMYTQMLAESYQQGGKFFGLNLPGAAIGELSLDFRFAVKGDLTYKEEENVNYSNIIRFQAIKEYSCAFRIIGGKAVYDIVSLCLELACHTEVRNSISHIFNDFCLIKAKIHADIQHKGKVLLIDRKREILHNRF